VILKLISDNIEITDEVREKFDKALEGVTPMIYKKARVLAKQVGEDVEDVAQMYRMVLLASISRYDPSKKVKFSTYFYQAISQVGPMIYDHYMALKRVPHTFDEDRKPVKKPHNFVYPEDYQWDGQYPVTGRPHQGEWLATPDNPEGTLLKLEQMEVDRAFRLALIESLTRPIDKEVAKAIFNPTAEIQDKKHITKDAALRYLCKRLAITRPQLKASLSRIKQTALKVAHSPNNIFTKTHHQSESGEIIIGGQEMTEKNDMGCLGWHDPAEAQCIGNPEAAEKVDKEACGDLADCKIVTAVAQHEGVKPEVLFAPRKEKGRGMTMKQIKAFAKKNDITYTEPEPAETKPVDPPAEDAKTDEAPATEPEAKADETPAETPAEAKADDKSASEDKPTDKDKAKVSMECRALVDDLTERLAKDHGKQLKTKPAADTEGALYVLDKTPMAGGGSNYMTLYSHREKGRDQGVVICYLKPRTKTLDIGVACTGADQLNKILKGIKGKHGLKAKDTLSDGAFKGRILGVGTDGLDIVVAVVKSLVDSKQLEV
jgi:DNA-directed RNA polymerase specialized sigma24 family protein